MGAVEIIIATIKEEVMTLSSHRGTALLSRDTSKEHILFLLGYVYGEVQFWTGICEAASTDVEAIYIENFFLSRDDKRVRGLWAF